MRRKTSITLFKHQNQSLKILKRGPHILDFSEPGCVSADTEFLTPTGWKRIDCYTEGDQVAQFHPDTREIEFVEPQEYIKRPCDTMIAIAPTRGMSQRLSHEHRVLYYMPDGTHGVMSAAQYMAELHKKSPAHFQARFCTTFSVRSTQQLPLSDLELRLMVAVIADGHFGNGGTRCTIRLKKQRKQQRLYELLTALHLDYAQHTCGGQPDFQVFRFYAPRRDKVFNAYWWGASQRQLEIIADELPWWDSSEDSRSSNATRFSSFEEQSADFAQYAFSAAKRPSSLTYSARDRRNEGRGIMVEYNVHARTNDTFIGPGRKDSVYEVKNPEGYKYCFEVPSSFLLLRHNGHIFATGNTGKTGVHLLDFAARRTKRGGKALVIAPKTLLYSAWAVDAAKFTSGLTVSLAYAHNREAAFKEDADIYVTNHDAAVWLAKKPKTFFKQFDTLIIDESDAFKHHTANRSKGIAKIAKHFTYRRVLCGTPMSNGVTDVWHQALICDGGKRLGTSFFHFRSAVCQPEQVNQRIKWVDKPGAEAAVAGLLADITISHKLRECVDLPPNHEYSVPYLLPPKTAKAYTQMELAQITWLEAQPQITAVNAAVAKNKLLQIASGAAYNDEGSYTLIDTGRYELVADLVEARPHTVVFFLWTHQRDELIRVFDARGLSYTLVDGSINDATRRAAVQGFQAGSYRVFLAHPQAAGHGLTLTRATATIYASPTYNLTWYLQGKRRIERIGQTEKTETIVVTAADTIDQHAWDAMQGKREVQDSFLNMVNR